MSEAQQTQLATLLGVTVGAALDLGFTPSQIADVFKRKSVLAAAEILLASKIKRTPK